jgi:hypothetical protein
MTTRLLRKRYKHPSRGIPRDKVKFVGQALAFSAILAGRKNLDDHDAALVSANRRSSSCLKKTR